MAKKKVKTKIKAKQTSKRAAKILVYSLIAVTLAVVVSPELKDLVVSKPVLMAYAPLINVVLASLGDILRQVKPELEEIL